MKENLDPGILITTIQATDADSGNNSMVSKMELSSINKISLVQVSSCSNTGSIRDDFY